MIKIFPFIFIFLWSSAFITTKPIIDSSDPFAALAFRFFFVAVGSQANVGGAASAPIVASAFHPSLAPVGVLLAVFGYALGTYAAWFCAILMQSAVG